MCILYLGVWEYKTPDGTWITVDLGEYRSSLTKEVALVVYGGTEACAKDPDSWKCDSFAEDTVVGLPALNLTGPQQALGLKPGTRLRFKPENK